jgi:hypothetical protein
MEKLSCPFSHLGKPMSLHLSTQKTAVVWAGFGWLWGSKMDCRPALAPYQNPLDFPILLTNSLHMGLQSKRGSLASKQCSPNFSHPCNHTPVITYSNVDTCFASMLLTNYLKPNIKNFFLR